MLVDGNGDDSTILLSVVVPVLSAKVLAVQRTFLGGELSMVDPCLAVDLAAEKAEVGSEAVLLVWSW